MSFWGIGGKRRATIVALASAIAVATAALAEQPTREELEDRVRRLERIIRDAGLDQPAKAKAVRKAGTRPATTVAAPDPALGKEEVEAVVEERLRKQKVLAGWKDGFFLESSSGDFKLKLRGYVQADARFFPLEESDTGTDSLFLRRVRPIFEGTVYKYVDFRIMPDFGGSSPTLQDGYVRVNYWPQAQLTAGKFKSPLSLERLQSGADLTFIERSLANNLAPNREVGITLGGNLLQDRLSYQFGVFNGSFDGGSNDGDTTSDKDFQGRVFGEPFEVDGPEPLKGLGFGLAATYGTAKAESYSGTNYRTAGRSSFFRFDTPSGVSVDFDGTRTRVAPQMYWYWGPFGMMGEYFVGETDLERVEEDAAPSSQEFETSGWFLQASYLLTGEQATYKSVSPINVFDPVNGRWGAFELAARVSGVDIDNDVFTSGFAKEGNATNGAMAYTAGLNWYLNKNFKMQINYEHTDFDQEVSFGGDDRGSEDVFLTRFQLSY